MDKRRRNPLHKEHFLEGSRQKWMAVFILCAGAVLYMTAKHEVDPVPFMEFLTLSVLAFVVGTTATSAIAGWKRGSIEEAKVRECYAPDKIDGLDEQEGPLD